MACDTNPSSNSYGPRTVWSGKSDVEANAIFHPLTDGLDANQVKLVRYAIQVDQSSGATKVKPALRTSNDNLNWTSPATIGTQSVTGNGTSFPTAYTDIGTTAAGTQLIQFGILVYNSTSGLAVEVCNATVKIDTKAC